MPADTMGVELFFIWLVGALVTAFVLLNGRKPSKEDWGPVALLSVFWWLLVAGVFLVWCFTSPEKTVELPRNWYEIRRLYKARRSH